MKAKKLTVLESRASRFCDTLKENGGGTLNISWGKSRDYGHCPAAFDYRGEKMAYASGCGYDKLSVVMSDALAFLAPEGETLHCHGAGESAVRAKLLEWGWKLERTVNGPTFDAFTLSRVPA